MRRIWLGLSLAVLLLGGAPALTSRRAQSQDDQAVPLDDSFWQGTITVEVSKKGRGLPGGGGLTGFRESEENEVITFTLDHVPRLNDADQWENDKVPFVIHGSRHILEVIPPDGNYKGCRRQMRSTKSGSGTATIHLTPEADDEGKPVKIRLWIYPNSDDENVTQKSSWVTTTEDGTKTQNDETKAGAGGIREVVVPYDPDQRSLSGEKTKSHTNEEQNGENLPGVYTEIIRYNLTLSRPSDTEAVIETPDGYETWWPKADKSEDKAGPSPILVKVRLHKKGEPKKPAPHKAQFKFELVDTSKEKGVCLNWPPEDTAKPPAFDLRIEQDKNDDLKVTDGKEGQRAESKGKHLSEGLVVLSSFDWGAYGKLKVTAILDDGKKTKVEAHLDSDRSKYELKVPKDEDDNYIADDWEEFHDVYGGDDADDLDAKPEGDKDLGDGLTLYEEYRGFMEAGEHKRGDPEKKDFFICNKAGKKIKPGIKLFEGITELEVFSKFTEKEMGPSRIINRNHSKMAHVVDQHGIFIVRGNAGLTSMAEPEPGSPPNIMGTPKRHKQVKIGTGILGGGFSSADRASTVAHELLHCCDVWHHGATDLRKKLIKAWTDPSGNKSIRVFNLAADGSPIGEGTSIILVEESTHRTLSANNPGLVEGFRAYIGGKRGEHSGNVDCVMRYDCAEIYINNAGEYAVFLDSEKTGMGLCEKGTGTGVNDPDFQPCPSRPKEPRYGPATETRGECLKRICVNDKYH